MFKYVKVDLNPNASSINFPKCCIECGQLCGNEVFEISGHVAGLLGLWKKIAGNTPKLRPPCHNICGSNLKKNSLIRGRMLILIFFAGLGLYFYIYRCINSLAILLLILLPLIILDKILDIFWFQNPIVFTQYDDKLSFIFRDQRYAQEFTDLNKENIYKKRLRVAS